MVTASPEQLREQAICYFREPKLPESLAWAEWLSPVHQRLFAVELADALKGLTLTGDGIKGLRELSELIEGWEATAEIDAAPEVAAFLRKPKDYEAIEV